MLLLILWTETLIGGLLNPEGVFLTKMQIPATDWEKTIEKYRLLFYNQNFRPCRPLFLATKIGQMEGKQATLCCMEFRRRIISIIT